MHATYGGLHARTLDVSCNQDSRDGLLLTRSRKGQRISAHLCGQHEVGGGGADGVEGGGGGGDGGPERVHPRQAALQLPLAEEDDWLWGTWKKLSHSMDFINHYQEH